MSATATAIRNEGTAWAAAAKALAEGSDHWSQHFDADFGGTQEDATEIARGRAAETRLELRRHRVQRANRARRIERKRRAALAS